MNFICLVNCRSFCRKTCLKFNKKSCPLAWQSLYTTLLPSADFFVVFVAFGASVPLCKAKQFFYCKGVAYKINATVSKFLQP